MAAPVWQLSVDLQAKTATFSTGLADAAKAARGSFNDIKREAGEAGGEVGFSMMEARHSVMMLGEEFGIHLPRALAGFIAGLGPLGPALEAAFPFLAIAGLATLLIEHLVKMHEAGEKLTADQVNFGTTAQTAFNALDEKLIQAKIRADELRNDHLGALRLQLEMIDHQSMAELIHSFEELGKAADEVMKGLESHWYTFGVGSDGANHALKDFGLEYRALAAAGDAAGASGLLHGTLDQARKVLALQKEAQATTPNRSATGAILSGDAEKHQQALLELQHYGVSATEDEVKAQEQMVAVLTKQLGIEERVAALKKQDDANATKATANKGEAQASAAARQAAESMMRMGEQSIAAERATADAALTIHRASLEARLASDIDFAARERDTQLAGNQAQIAALDKSSSDYVNQLKALKEKSLEISNEYDTKVAQLTAKAAVAENERDLAAVRQHERDTIEATQQGSAQRLAVIDTTIRAEQAAHLQDTNFYRELLTQRVEALRQETEEENKLHAEAAKESADSGEKMGALSIAAIRQQLALEDSAHHVSAERRVAEDTMLANLGFDNKMAAMQKEAAGLDKSAKDYENKLRQIQDHEKQLVQEHANELAAIKIKAEEESNARILAAESRRNDTIARGLTQSIMGHQSWAKMVSSLGDQVASGMLQNVIKSMLMDDMDKERDAARAARKAYNIGIGIGGPAGMILGPTFAAAAFAGVMAFSKGTDSVPGIGNTDSVPAMLTPREGVVPGGVMDGLRTIARNGGFTGGGPTVHLHMTNHMHASALDADGVDEVFEKHAAKIQGHFQAALRRMNK